MGVVLRWVGKDECWEWMVEAECKHHLVILVCLSYKDVFTCTIDVLCFI